MIKCKCSAISLILALLQHFNAIGVLKKITKQTQNIHQNTQFS